MACPRLGKVDRRLVQARHSLFDLALTIPPASLGTPVLEKQHVARAFPAIGTPALQPDPRL
jgi:hypothetical protein